MTSTARELSPSQRLDWLCLSRSENVGPITFFQLLRHFGSADQALRGAPDLARRGGRRALRICSRDEGLREIEACAEIGARLVAAGEPDYPPALAAIADPPPLITLRGHGHLLRERMIAVVGARNASASGMRFARQLANELGAEDFVVVSGLARGIDASAHEGALAADSQGTVAVVGGGIDVIYPPENQALHERIAEQGAIIGEMPLGTIPKARHFPRRNRIISGVSLGVVVIEAARRSGSLITARLAGEQGREVFAVPGSPLDPRCTGTNNLIRQGAVLTEGAADVTAAFAGMLIQPLDEYREALDFDPESRPESDESEIERARFKITQCLGPTPVSVDEIIRQCQVTASVVLTVLLELELAGRLDRYPGNQFSLRSID
ncbi:MAG: DNA-protecting protein DprA [Proteobacteria bacterium]|nr:DNA-protecting protein DprA [Pseudomonadota bacterium]